MDNIHVYQAIAAITDEMSKEGIKKDGRNQQQGYAFRGIDAVLNALSPMLAKHKLNILPRCTERDCVERTTTQGKPIFYVTVKSDFDFVSAVDGSKHTVTTYGEAMDSADKATNKAMSAAYKYAAFQAFCIPTEGDNDADAVTHEVAPQPVAAPRMDENTRLGFLRAINMSKTSDEATANFKTANEAAKQANDPTSSQEFKAAAVARKQQLTTQGEI